MSTFATAWQRAREFVLEPNPIVVKELRATFRAAIFVRFLYISTAVVCLLVLTIGAAVATDSPPASVGQVVFQLFMLAGLLLVILFAPGYAATAITTEQEQGTWESLLLSGMSPPRIVIGKFAAAYASIALVLVALAPVTGIAFLFGGVSPIQVLVGFVSLLVVLVPAIAFGVAISARIRSTRLAVVVATGLFFVIGVGATAVMWMLQEPARGAWGIAMEGPFWYTEAFATRGGEWQTWAYLLGLPVYILGISSWFLLASAVAGVRPPSDDRARPFKVWAVVLTFFTILIAVLAVADQPTSEEAADTYFGAVLFFSFVPPFFSLLLANDAPLPPRHYEVWLSSLSLPRRTLGVLFGPGAGSTMRFSIVLSFVSLGALFAAGHVTARITTGRWWQFSHNDTGAFVLCIGAFTIAFFLATLTTHLRLALRHGAAARVLALSIGFGATIAPFFLALLLRDNGVSDIGRHPPLSIAWSPFHPWIVAMVAADGDANLSDFIGLGFPLLIYGSLGLVFYILVEARVYREKRDAAVRRARFRNAEPA